MKPRRADYIGFAVNYNIPIMELFRDMTPGEFQDLVEAMNRRKGKEEQ